MASVYTTKIHREQRFPIRSEAYFAPYGVNTTINHRVRRVYLMNEMAATSQKSNKYKENRTNCCEILSILKKKPHNHAAVQYTIQTTLAQGGKLNRSRAQSKGNQSGNSTNRRRGMEYG